MNKQIKNKKKRTRVSKQITQKSIKRVRTRRRRWCNVKQGGLPYLPTEVWILILHYFAGDWILHLIQQIGWKSHHPLISASMYLISSYLRIMADHLNYTSTKYKLSDTKGVAIYSNVKPPFHANTRLASYLPPVFPKYKLNNQLMDLYKSISNLPHNCWQDMKDVPIQKRMVNIVYQYFGLYMQHQHVHWALKKDVSHEDFIPLMIDEGIRGIPTGFSIWIWIPGYTYRFMIGFIINKPTQKKANQMTVTRLYRAVYVAFDGVRKHYHTDNFGYHLSHVLSYIYKHMIKPRGTSMESILDGDCIWLDHKTSVTGVVDVNDVIYT